MSKIPELAITRREAGGQPISAAGGPLTEPIKTGIPDQSTNAFFDYGVNEGIPRSIDLCDKHNIKVTSFMTGRAVERHPELTRGHEAAAHGPTWQASCDLPRRALLHPGARSRLRHGERP